MNTYIFCMYLVPYNIINKMKYFVILWTPTAIPIFKVKSFDSWNLNNTVVPRSYATPSNAIFAAMLFWIGSKKIQVKLFSSQLHYFFPPVTLFSSFPPKLHYHFPRSYAISSFSP